MKKVLTVLVALMLVLSMTTAFAAVPSKTTNPTIVDITTVSGDPLPEGFTITTVGDTTMTIEQVEKLYEFVKEGNAPIDFFEPEVQNAILAKLNENKPSTEALTLDDLRDWEINEIVSVDATNYDPAAGDIVVTFEFATPYQLDQRMVGILDCYDGTRTEVEPNVFEFNSEKIVLGAEVKESEDDKSLVDVTFTADAIVKMQESVANALSIFSEPMK
ncbi:MAG: hypothetical protein IJ048_05930 [Clostridia bacterium]|nr:hypothetical protein [Clostridia bacterium]